MSNPAGPKRVHLPSGYLPSGKRVRAGCWCGWITTPRVDQRRALEALLSEHGFTDPVCKLCGADYNGRSWDEILSRHVEILTDPVNEDEFIVCRHLPQSCRDGATQRQLHLDQAAGAALGIEMPRPKLRLIRPRP
ncbi:hypothetical protein [Lentzea sp. NBRC 102530]|uniref:hypothetical protein n=1 Tax=Lentzea sp. NBRC 102530 TaxID=3032201 RepID=UPI0024A4EEB4|nr:hypothetical protein [Lentzea sp. NBRC 102530]GLY55198.1 hypothetical protein Lesp01_88530 [Lentzea sp. NBRC 102530]